MFLSISMHFGIFVFNKWAEGIVKRKKLITVWWQINLNDCVPVLRNHPWTGVPLPLTLIAGVYIRLFSANKVREGFRKIFIKKGSEKCDRKRGSFLMIWAGMEGTFIASQNINPCLVQPLGPHPHAPRLLLHPVPREARQPREILYVAWNKSSMSPEINPLCRLK